MKMVIFLILTLVIWNVSVLAMSSKDLNCNKSYRVLVHDFQTSANESLLLNITKRIGGMIETETGCRFGFEKSSTIRGLLDMQSHRADIFGTMTHDKDWDRVAVLVPVWKVKRVLLVRDSKYMPDSVDQILTNPKYKFGVQTGISFFFREEELKKLREQKRTMEGASLNSLVNLFKAGKINSFFVPVMTLPHIEKRLGKDARFKLIVDGHFEFEVGFYVSKTRLLEAEVNRIKDAVHVLTKKGAIKELFEQSIRPDLLPYYSL